MLRTIIFSYITSLTLIFGQDTLKIELDMCSSPTKKEFDIYKELCKMLWEAPIRMEWEQVVVEHIARKYSITNEVVNKIDIKISYYNIVQNYGSMKPVETMTWIEFKSIIRKYGNPFPEDCE